VKNAMIAIAICAMGVLCRPAAADGEKEQIRQLEAKVKLLEATIRQRDDRIAELERQIEDLEGKLSAAESGGGPDEPMMELGDSVEVVGGDEQDEAANDPTPEEGTQDGEGPEGAESAETAAPVTCYGVKELDAFVRKVASQGRGRQTAGLGIIAGNGFQLTGKVICVGSEVITPPRGDAGEPQTVYVVEMEYQSDRIVVKRGPGQRGTGANSSIIYPGPILSETRKQVIHIRAFADVRPNYSPGDKLAVTGTIASMSLNNATGEGKLFCWEATLEGQGCQFEKK